MAISLSQSAHTNYTAAVSSGTVALSGVTAGGCLVLAIFTGNGAEAASVTDNNGGLWCRACFANASGSLDVELWYASGHKAGNTTVTVTLGSVSGTDFTLTLAEFAGVAGVNALDLECANAGTSNTPAIGATLTGWESGELFVGACKTSVAITSTPAGFSAITTGATGDSMMYLVDSGMSGHAPAWGLGSGPLWLTAALALVPYATGPTLNSTTANMPQTHCEISVASGPFPATQVWRNVNKYLQKMTESLGRQHNLDRFEAADITMIFDGRDGWFNAWNTSGPLYASGVGLLPMTAVKMLAYWSGVPYYVAYGYLDNDQPQFQPADAMNETVSIHAYDILEFLQNSLLNNNNYAVLIEAAGSLASYWRCGDVVGSSTLTDSSSAADTATLINGVAGMPLLGQNGQILYDSSTSLDLTNGTGSPSGGFSAPNPVPAQANWTFEAWVKYIGKDLGVATNTICDTNTNAQLTNVGDTSNVEVGWIVVGANIPNNTQVIGISGSTIYISQNATATVAKQSVIFAPLGTLMTTTVSAGELDIRMGAYTSGSGMNQGTVYNRLLFGLVSGGVFTSYANTSGLIPLFDGNWHHIVATVAASASTNLKVYIDGILDVQAAIGANFQPNSLPNSMIVGCNAGPTNGFVAVVQDVATYSSILSASDALAHYAQGVWLQYVETGGGSQTVTAPNGITTFTSSGRMNTVLSISGFGGTTAVCQTLKTQLYAESNAVTTTSALDYMQRISETEPGPIFQGPDGNVYVLSRQYVIGQGTAVGLMNPGHAVTSQGVFGDTAGSTYRFVPKDLLILRDKLDLYNDFQTQSSRPVNAANPVAPVLESFGPVQDTRMAQSKTNFGRRSYQGLTQLLWQNDADALAVAQWGGITYASGIQFRVQITINQIADSGLNLVQMLGRQIYDRITVEYQGLVPGSEFGPTDFLIEHISHNFDWDEMGPLWETTFVLSPFEINYAYGVGGNGELEVQNVEGLQLGVWTFGSASSSGQLTL